MALIEMAPRDGTVIRAFREHVSRNPEDDGRRKWGPSINTFWDNGWKFKRGDQVVEWQPTHWVRTLH